MAADVHLEHVGAPLREIVDGIFTLAARGSDRVFVDQAIAAAGQREREYRHHRRTRAESQRRHC